MTTMTTPATDRATDVPGHRRAVGARTTFIGGLVGSVLALAATSAIYAVGNVGAPIRVVTGWAPDGANLRVAEMVITVLVAVALGTVLLEIARRRSVQAWSAWVVTASVIAVGSAVPLFQLDVDLGSKLSLASMHLATGAAAVAGQVFARRRAVAVGGAA